ncbi:MAG: MoaD/ThiS family protein [Verrucomicrobia bacterium]|jgi:molybdopterin converting factor small subunit|nr:MoaD/ThiS family protein [Verrucomicrobiota bacterium]
MTVRLQYFSHLKNLRGPDCLEVPEGTTVAELLEAVFTAAPPLRDWDRHLLVAVGEAYAGRKAVLRPGDLVSLMPPVQGG